MTINSVVFYCMDNCLFIP